MIDLEIVIVHLILMVQTIIYPFNQFLNLSNNTKSSLHIETNKFTASSWIYMDGGGCNPRVFSF